MALVAGLACSAVVDPDQGSLGNPPPTPCEPGTVYDECACEYSVLKGTQTCTELERYDVCVCPVPSSAGTGAR